MYGYQAYFAISIFIREDRAVLKPILANIFRFARGISRDGDGNSLATVTDSLRVSELHLDLNDTQVAVANPASQANSVWNGMTVEASETDI